MEENKERMEISLTEHLFIFEDDPFKVLYKGRDGKGNWLKFITNQAATSLLSEGEREQLKAHRSLMSIIEGDPQAYSEEKVKEELGKIFPKYAEMFPVTPPKENSIPKSKEEAEARKAKEKGEEKPRTEFTVAPGSELALAKAAGLPPEMANLFFIKITGNAYITVAGLLFMAGKIGYRRIEISDRYDEKIKTWIAEAKIYPKIDLKTLETLSKLSPEVQKEAYSDLSKPTNGIGMANVDTVQVTRMHNFLREMAQTRALGRALRSYTGYGSTTYEELPDAKIDEEK